MRYAPLLTVLLLMAALPAPAQTRAAVEAQFRLWLEQVVWPQADRAGVRRGTFEAAFTGVTLDWSLPDLAPPGRSLPAKPRQQAEFAAPARYFSRGTLNAATAQGRRMAARHADTLERVTRGTGVPGHIILGIWGRESAYGKAVIPYDAFRVLGTKGFMSTRAAYFTEELIAALRLAETRHAGGPSLRSSWAGALGQPQFMPSNVLRYARDGDGDGRADIWRSADDTIASIGHYLAAHGWVAGRDWGFEVAVPPTVSCTLEGPDQGRPISAWAAMGIRRISGRPFPAHERRAEGYLLMPAGRYGPAFIVTPNFYVLKDYNMSDLYALFVGHVGDRIAFGLGDFAGRWRETGGLTRGDITTIQKALVAQGHDTGGVDGLPGYKTRRSIGRWQEARGQAATCFPETALTARLKR